jgi:hypothetical protein
VTSVIDLRFDESFWTRGEYPSFYENNTVPEKVDNPWYKSGANSAPFDQCRSSCIGAPHALTTH